MNEDNIKFLTVQDYARLDRFLTSRMPGYSRNQIQRWIQNGRVRVNGVVVTKNALPLERGNSVLVSIPEPQTSQLIPEPIPLDIIYEDDNLLVINKPPGMVVHPSPGHESGTLVHAVLAHAPELRGVGGVKRPGVVHRLDKDTSGLIIMAKDDDTHRFLQGQFKQRSVEKTYLALVDGHPPTSRGRIEAPIGRDPSRRQRMAVVPPTRGREACTTYETLKKFDRHTYLEVRLLTGRTHQIRVHMAFLKNPIVGDTIYGRKKPSLLLDRQFLHAARLRILIPGKVTPLCFEAPLAEDLQHALESIR